MEGTVAELKPLKNDVLDLKDKDAEKETTINRLTEMSTTGNKKVM